jgi:hypothetical protein
MTHNFSSPTFDEVKISHILGISDPHRGSDDMLGWFFYQSSSSSSHHGKSKVFLVPNLLALHMGEWRYSSTILDLGTRWRD